MFKKIALSLPFVASTLAATFMSNQIEFTLNSKSAGLKIASSSAGAYLSLEQRKIECVDANGASCSEADGCWSIDFSTTNVTWSSFVEHSAATETDAKVLRSHFTTTAANGVTLEMIAYIAETKGYYMQPSLCSGCSNAPGYCKSDTTFECAGELNNVVEACPTGYTHCTGRVVMDENELKYSIKLNNLPSLPEGHMIKYTTGLSTHENDVFDHTLLEGTAGKRWFVEGVGEFETPTHAVSTSGTGSTLENREITITTSVDGTVAVFELMIPCSNATHIYYDPAMELIAGYDDGSVVSDGSGSGSEGESESKDIGLIIGLVVGGVALAAFIAMVVAKNRSGDFSQIKTKEAGMYEAKSPATLDA